MVNSYRSGSNARLDRVDLPFENVTVTPGVITAVYLLIGFGGLAVSDFVLPRIMTDPLLARVQAIKGGAEVLGTAVVLFVLSKKSRSQVEESRDRLDRQRRELEILHRVLRHNIRNDMNVIQGYTDLLGDDTDDDTLQKRCRKIQDKVSETIGYTEKANRIRRVSEVSTVETDVSGTVEHVLETHDEVDGVVSVTLDLEDDLNIRANQMFEEAVYELIENAVLNANDSPVQVEVRSSMTEENGAFGVVEVADNGPGIDEDTQQVLTAGSESKLMHLEGLGLWFVYWTVIESGGEFAIESSEQAGSRVRMKFPLA
ncbi:MAG: ATP-binding protein [Halodesulfurarchaeum sp.]